MFHVFHRVWWKLNPNYPDGREPYPSATKHTIAYVDTEEEARALCKEWCANNPPGILSDKAEYQSV